METSEVQDGTDQLPPLPKGFTPVKQQDIPALPKGFTPVDQKKKSTSFDFTHGYQPTAEDIRQKKSIDDLEAGFDKPKPTSSQFGDGLNPFQNTQADLTPVLPEHRDEVRKYQNSHGRAIDVAKAQRSVTVPPTSEKDKPERSFMDKVGQAVYLPAIKQGFNDLIVSPAAGATDFIDRTIDKAYQGIIGEKTPDWLRKKGFFHDVSKQIQDEYDTRDKPKNMVSDIAEGVMGTLPLMASMYTGEGEVSLATKAPQLFGRLAKTLATTKGLTAYKDATDNHEGYLQSLEKGVEGAAKGGVEGQFMDAQMLVGGALGKGVATKLEEMGALKGGKATKAILHALSVGTVFGGTSAGEDLLQGKDINTDNALKQFGTGLAFELIPTAKSVHDELSDRITSKKINNQAAQVASVANSASNMNAESALRTLINTPVEQIQQVHSEVPGGYEDLYANSIAQGAKAYETKDLDEKRNLYTQQLALKAQGDIKMIADKVKEDPTEIINSINENDEISPEEKSDLLNKVQTLYKSNEQTKSNQEVSTEQPADEAVGIPKVADQNDETTKNSPINPKQNETSDESNGEKSSQKGGEKSDAESKIGNEKNDAEKRLLTQTGGAETSPVIKTKEEPSNAVNKEQITESGGKKYQEGDKSGKTTEASGSNSPERTAQGARQKAIDTVVHEVVYSPNENSDGYLPRFDFGMKTSEKNKAVSDIKKGNYETAPAKKMLSLIQKWESEDSYPVIEGTGGSTARVRGATSSEIQSNLDDAMANKANEFTKSEVSELNGLFADMGVTYDDLKAQRDYEQYQERNVVGKKPAEVGTNEKAIQQPENDGGGNVGENRPSEESESPKRSTGKTTFKKPTVQISDRAKEIADKIRSLKSDKSTLHGGLEGVGVAIYDGALETAATVIENGGKVVEAIDEAVKHILAKSEEKDEDKVRASITKDLADIGIQEEPKEVTGIRHSDTEKERAEMGKSSDVAKKDRSRETIEAKGKDLVNEDPDYANRTAKDIIEKERPATAIEQAALEYRKTQLKNERRRIIKDTNPDNATDNEIRLAKITDEISLNQKATDIGGSELGSGLGYRTQLMNEDYSTETVLGRAKVANGGEELDPKDKAELEKRTKRIEDLENERDDLVERLKKQAENRLVDKVNRTANFEERQAKREVTKALLRKEREGLLAELQLMAKKSRGTLGANKIPVEMIVPLTKLARNYVLDGATTLSSVVDRVYNDLKDHIEDLNKEDISAAVKDNFDKYLTEQNALRLTRAKKLQQTKLEKLKSDTFEQKTFAKIQVDNDYLNIRAEINREQQRVNKKLADIENSKKSLNRKIVETAVKFGRQAKLASVTVLGKLAATGLATVGIKPIQEGIGKGISTILPRVAEKSTVEGSVSRKLMREASNVTDGAAVKSISQAITRAATIGMKDAYQELTGAGSNLTNLYKERGATLPSEAKEFFGHLHSAIKAPIKRFAWELSYAKRTAKMIEAGFDPTDPINDAQNRLNAYKDGERAIFMGDNTLSKIYENNVVALEKSSSSINRTLGATFRILLPFVKVPSNIVLEGGKYSFGSVSGTARLARAFANGIDNLSPEEADIILEHLKKGSIGAAAMAIGFFNPKAFGGFYQPGEKKKVGPKHIKIGDVNIPAFLVEHPLFTAAQVGANFRQLLDKYRHKDDRIPIAALATISGLGYEVPQANEIKRLVDLTGDIRSMKKWEKFGAETTKGMIEPAALQQLAEITDVKEGAKTNIPGLAFSEHTQQKREPKLRRHGFMKYVGQMLETGIPGLRKNVPKKH